MTNELKREVTELVDLVNQLLQPDENGGSATSRIVIDLPEAWLTLAAWLAARRRMELRGTSGPSPWPVPDLHRRYLRALANNYIASVLDEHFRSELRKLATGKHRSLRPAAVADKAAKGGPL
jgi:hypothetical protein